MPETRPTEYLVGVFLTKDLTELRVVRGLLESANIATTIRGEERLRHTGAQHNPLHVTELLLGRSLGAEILVLAADAEPAKELISSFQEAEPIDYDPDSEQP